MREPNAGFDIRYAAHRQGPGAVHTERAAVSDRRCQDVQPAALAPANAGQ